MLRGIEDAILNETSNRFERLVFLSVQGELLYACDGDVGGVELSGELVARLTGLVHLITHNHPHGLPFTISDLEGALRLRAREIDAFTARSRFRLFLDRHVQSWPWASVNDLRQTITAIDSQVRQIVAPAVKTGQASAQQAMVVHRHGRWRLLEEHTGGAIHYSVEAR